MPPFLVPLFTIISKLVERFFPNKDQQKAETASVELEELKSPDWLTRNWRKLPIIVVLLLLTANYLMFTVIPYVIVLFDLNVITMQDPGWDMKVIAFLKELLQLLF